ncbi:MAG: carboxypeptidase regulatory-like domain-containing protein [Acidobacteriota bacterium]|nr:carboxypeptidase regulatory-like domain-containing protein [Acidobacteriota bacterium]
MRTFLSPRFFFSFFTTLLTVFCLLAASAKAQTDQLIYTDSLQNGWQNWSWATANFNNSNPVHGGSASISVNAAAWQALYLHHTAQSGNNYTNLVFWIHGGASGGQQLQVRMTVGGAAQTAVALPQLQANVWQEITISLAALGVGSTTNFDGFWIQDTTGTTQPTFYVDGIRLVGGTPPPPPPADPITINVNAALNRRSINPQIYGVAHASTEQLAELNAPLNRSGGNNTSRYNWQQNADNRGNDWYFQSIPFANTPGEVGDSFIQNSRAAGAEPMLTVPIIDWVAKVGPTREKLSSYSIAKYGAQTDRDWQWFPDAGNGVCAQGNTTQYCPNGAGSFIVGNNPDDANVPNSVGFQQAWVQHLVGRWGTATTGGLRYYILDNEYSLWHSTHRDVQPIGATMEQVFTRMRDYAAMIKSIDPRAQIVGPEEWGWDGYRYSGYDQQYAPLHNWTFPDRAAHGNMDYVAWILQQFKLDEQSRGKRLLDVFTLHYYPQGGEFSDDVSPEMQLRRNRSTRSLWDPNYTDESWINDKVQLIPRMKNWVEQYYPGTITGITEYNWGAEAHINGATAQADIYGIFGREGLDMAARWTTPNAGTPTFKAMKMYRNYDGNKSTFGETSVSATVPNPDNVSAFAAQRSSDGALTVMVINKTVNNTPATINLTNFSSFDAVQVWQLTAANQINRIADAAVNNETITTTLPAQSITLFVVPSRMPTAASVSVSGRVMNAAGRGLRGVKVVLSGANGEQKTVLTNSFGYYRFADVSAGATYVINVFSKKHTFNQPTHTHLIQGETAGVDFIAND